MTIQLTTMVSLSTELKGLQGGTRVTILDIREPLLNDESGGLTGWGLKLEMNINTANILMLFVIFIQFTPSCTSLAKKIN